MGIKDEDIGDEKAAIAMLSDEERAALTEDAEEEAKIASEIAGTTDAEEDDPPPAAKSAAEDDDEDEDEDPDADADAEKRAAEAKAEQDAAAKAAEDAAASADNASKNADDVQHETIKFDPAPIERGYQDRLSQLDAEKADKFQKLMDGEISAKDYSEFESQYLRNRDAAASERTEALGWFKEVNEFQNQVLKSDGINYATDQKMNTALDRWVKQLAADPDNAHRDGVWFLKEAHEMVKMQYRIGTKQAAPAQQAEDKKPAKKGRAPDTSNIPPTLARLPAAAESDNESGEFAHLDNLSGIDLERALARLTPEQTDRYLRG